LYHYFNSLTLAKLVLPFASKDGTRRTCQETANVGAVTNNTRGTSCRQMEDSPLGGPYHRIKESHKAKKPAHKFVPDLRVNTNAIWFAVWNAV
jgi:hypothetical protein